VKTKGSVRSIKVAGILAILFGIFGLFTGFAAAGTFIPYRQGEPWSESAEVMTAVAAVGAVASLIAVVSGWGLRRTKGWAWGATVGVAVACVALNVVMAAFMGLSYLYFAAIVAVAYGIVVVLLLLGRASYRARTGTAPA